MVAANSKAEYQLISQQNVKGYDPIRFLDVLYEYWCDYRFWKSLKREVPFYRCKKVLDVGCGFTSVLNVIRRDFPHLELTGADPLMDEFRQFNVLDDSITWKRDCVECLQQPNAEFDVVCCTHALEYIDDVAGALCEVKRVVSPRGFIVLTLDIFARYEKSLASHQHCFTKSEVMSLLQQSGFLVTWNRLSRHKIGAMNYADLRIRRTTSRQAVYLRSSIREQVRSLAKRSIRRGALGELVVVARSR